MDDMENSEPDNYKTNLYKKHKYRTKFMNGSINAFQH